MSEKNNNSFESTVSSLFKGMDQFISSKTVVGDAITVGDTIILPLVDVSFGVGAGASSAEKKMCIRDRKGAGIDVAVIHLPHISNFTDFSAFERMDGVSPVSYTHLDVYKRQSPYRPYQGDRDPTGSDQEKRKLPD